MVKNIRTGFSAGIADDMQAENPVFFGHDEGARISDGVKSLMQ